MGMVFDKTLHSKSVKVKHLRQLSFYFNYKLLINKDLTRVRDSNFCRFVGKFHTMLEFPTCESRFFLHFLDFWIFSFLAFCVNF